MMVGLLNVQVDAHSALQRQAADATARAAYVSVSFCDVVTVARNHYQSFIIITLSHHTSSSLNRNRHHRFITFAIVIVRHSIALLFIIITSSHHKFTAQS